MSVASSEITLLHLLCNNYELYSALQVGCPCAKLKWH